MASFDFACIFQYKSICAVLVERGAAFHSFEPNNACVVGEECINPPAERGGQ
jgi:hypothetical protein